MLLKDIRVLDLSTLLPGPLCSMLLADLGADVIKIEGPKGDMMRNFEDSFFKTLNRSKKSIVIDLKAAEGKQIFKRLAKNADVIIEGFRPGKLDSLGLGYNEIKKINDDIIYCSITGYGQKGKNKDKAGHDLNYLALSGMLRMINEKPIVPGIQVADVSSALVAAFSIAASLYQRERSGKGSHIDVSIFSSALSFMGIHLAKYSLDKDFNRILSGKTPCYNIYETKDGKYMSLCAVEQKFWESFCKSVYRKDFLKKQFDSNSLLEFRSIFKSKTLKEWVGLNSRFDFCCEPVKAVNEAIKDNKESIVMMEGIAQAAFPAAFSSFKVKYGKSQKLGENTYEILRSIGYNKKSIENLKNKKIVSYGKA
ncbi:CoA transferase [Candidatus Woesearchaeota archaeon]|nr:CoA transferase [Candidatus Woesearchaeota archaeon]